MVDPRSPTRTGSVLALVIAAVLGGAVAGTAVLVLGVILLAALGGSIALVLLRAGDLLPTPGHVTADGPAI